MHKANVHGNPCSLFSACDPAYHKTRKTTQDTSYHPYCNKRAFFAVALMKTGNADIERLQRIFRFDKSYAELRCQSASVYGCMNSSDTRFIMKPGKRDRISMITFADLPFVDCHFHMHMLVDQVNKANMHVSRDNPDKSSVMDLMELCNLNAINIVSSAGAIGYEEHMNENLVAALAKALHPDKIYAFGGLHHQWPGVSEGDLDYARQARRLMDIGFDGIKMIEGKPTVRRNLGKSLDSEGFDDYYGFLEAEQFPILLHVGDPEGFWNPGSQYSDSSYVGREELYNEADRVLAKFPELRIIFAHFYFMSNDIDRSAAFLDKWPNISFDLTPGPTMYTHFSKEPKKWREFFVKYQDRILFGTDNHGEKRNFGPQAPDEYWPTPKIIAMRTFLETDRELRGWHSDLKGICLEKGVLEKIYCKNFQRYAGKAPGKLNAELILEECKHVLDFARKNSVEHNILSQIQEFLEAMAEI